MRSISKFKQIRILLVLTITLSFLIINLQNAEVASGEYGVKVGQSFQFNVIQLHDEDGSKILFNLGGVLLQEGCTMEITFTHVDSLYVQYRLTSNLGNYDTTTTLLANILVQDRNWTGLRTEYEALGYTVYEDEDMWGLEDNSSGYLDVKFNKEDGVMTNFYCYNYTYIVEQINLFEVEFERFGYGSKNWMISFIYFIPLVGTIIGFSMKAAGKGMAV